MCEATRHLHFAYDSLGDGSMVLEFFLVKYVLYLLSRAGSQHGV